MLIFKAMKRVLIFLFALLPAAPLSAQYASCRPPLEERRFVSAAVEARIAEVQAKLANPKLSWMFANCYPNTLDTTVDFTADDGSGHPDTFVITGDIFAMWLRDSGAQVWPYVPLAKEDEHLRQLIEGTIRRQLHNICIDPYANAFNKNREGGEFMTDFTDMRPELHERKWELDSPCYAIRLAYAYWKTTGDISVFDDVWMEAMQKVLAVFHEQQRKESRGTYRFMRRTEWYGSTKADAGYGNPLKPVGLIASAFRPSDDATVFDFLVPSNFFTVSSLRKAAEILEQVGTRACSRQVSKRCNASAMAADARSLASEVESALKEYAVYDHPVFGRIYAFEVDGFGNHLLMDDANVPSLLGMPYLGDVPLDDPVYQNTRRFVLSGSNPYFYKGAAGEGTGGPHVGSPYIWPMSIILRAFTSSDDAEIRSCIEMLLANDAGTGFMHEAFHADDATRYTRSWFAWANTLFGELIIKLLGDGKADLLNSIR